MITELPTEMNFPLWGELAESCNRRGREYQDENKLSIV